MGLKVKPEQGPPAYYKTFQAWSQAQAQKSHMDVVEKPEKKYQDILDKYPGLLQCDFKSEEPKHQVINHIDTGLNAPCTAKPRKLLPGSPKAIKGKQCWDELEALGIVERVPPGQPTLWSSPLHFVDKANGELRAVGDFRGLNDRTSLDTYPLPNIRHFASKIRGATVFSRVDMLKAFHLIPLDEDSQNKTTTLTPWGAFRYKRLAMGLRNSGQSFQRLVDFVLRDMDNIFVYMDDVLIYSKNEQDHLATLDELFRRLDQNGLTISLKKCLFGKEKLDFLGYQVSKTGITPLPKKVQAITEFPTPTKPKQLLGFLGAINYYRRSLPKFKNKTPAEWLQPLYEVATKKLTETAFIKIWTDQKLQENFEVAKQLLVQACELCHPDPNNPIAITCDASKYAIGAVLEQFSEGKWMPLGFWSRHLKPATQKWSTFRRELLAVKEAMRHFQPETEGRHVIIFTDHKALLGAFKSPSSQAHDPIAANHIQEVTAFTNDIRFIAGKANAVADWLSRPPEVPLGTAYQLFSPAEISSLQRVALNYMQPEAIAKDQAKCPDVKAHRKGQRPKAVKMEDVSFGDVTLYCDTSTGNPRPLLPKQWRDTTMKLFHNLSHPGNKATFKKISEKYYWPDMRKHISIFVRKCHQCQSCKSPSSIVPPLHHRPVSDKRFRDLQIDVVGPLPVSEGMRYLLTVLDRTTRWIEAFPMSEASSKNCALAFIRGWVQRFGIPCNTTSDNGSTFTSNLWTDLNEAIGIQVSLTPTYHPQSLGGVERQHKDIKLGLKTTLMQMGDEFVESWMDRLPWVMLSRRTCYQPALDATAADLVFGSTPLVPGDILGEPGPEPTSEQLKDLLKGLRINASRPPVQTTHSGSTTANYPDMANVTHVYVRKGKTSPLGKVFDGPFPILEHMGTACIKIQVGLFANGEPRTEIQHWQNCKIAHLPPDAENANRSALGRKPNQPKPATVERPRPGRKKTSPVPDDIPLATNVDTVPDTTVTTRSGRKINKPIRFS